jgi:LPXTG-motif cell wall-anchored protein
LKAPTPEARKTILAQMQNLIYDKAVYDILYYDSNLEAYRTDRFAGWTNQPQANGVPFFTYSTLQYTKLTNAALAPSAAPSESASAASPGASGSQVAVVATPAPSGGVPASTGSNGSMTPLIIGIVALVAIVAVGLTLSRRRSRAAADVDDE